MKKTAIQITILLFLLNGATIAQVPKLVYDLNPLGASSSPGCLTILNNKLYFLADDGNTGFEIWRYEGVNIAPTLMMEMGAGTTTAIMLPNSGGPLPVLNGRMYFRSYKSTPPYTGLFSYDGVNPPTAAVNVPDTFFTNYQEVGVLGNRMFFGGTLTNKNIDLYAYDGANPPVAYDINPDTGSSLPHSFIPFNGKLYFCANNGTAGDEPHVYDPATNSVSLITDLNPGPQGSNCSNFKVAGNKLFFIAKTSGYGSELHMYDGSTITRLTDMAPGPLHGVVTDLGYYNGGIIFGGSPDADISFATRYDIATGQFSRISNDTLEFGTPNGFMEYKGNLYFSQSTWGQLQPSRGELWKYNGSLVSLVADINPGWRSSHPRFFTNFQNHLFFSATDSMHGTELYQLSDETGLPNGGFTGSLKIYPNPAVTTATLELTLDAGQALCIRLTDMSGREVYTTGLKHYPAGKNSISIPVHSLPPGSYGYGLTSASGRKLASGILIRI